jgi:hypothetical protein
MRKPRISFSMKALNPPPPMHSKISTLPSCDEANPNELLLLYAWSASNFSAFYAMSRRRWLKEQKAWEKKDGVLRLNFFPGDSESYGVLLLVRVEKNKCRCASQNVLVSSMCAGKCCRWSRSAGGGGGVHQSVLVASVFLLL